jgi:hypothetical protein
MPPRFITLAIIAFWLAMVGLFVYGEVWPRLRPSEPLLFPVDVVDEAGQGHRSDEPKYYVFKNGSGGYLADLDWDYHPEDDSFESKCVLNLHWTGVTEAPRPEGPAWLPQVHNVRLTSAYRLTRNGELKAIASTTEYRLVAEADDQSKLEVKAVVGGEPRAGRLVPHLELTFPELAGPAPKFGPLDITAFDRDTESVAVSTRGTVLNPLHPPRRFANVSPGQRWRVTMIDPLALPGLVAPLDAARGGALRRAGIDAGAGAYVLDVRVLPELDIIDWRGGNQVPCHVIQCSADGPVGPITYWARQRDGAILHQEVSLDGDVWTFELGRAGFGSPTPPTPWKSK